MAEVTAKQTEVVLPGQADGQDLRGFVPKVKLEKAPYVKDRSGMIWPWQDWMHDMGDVLEPCWQAPPKPALVIPTSPMDLAHYSQTVRTESEAAQRPEAKSPSVQADKARAKSVQKRKSSRSKGKPRAPAVTPSDDNAQ